MSNVTNTTLQTEKSQLADNLTIIRRTGKQTTLSGVKKVRVAAYCRVSKNIEEQKTSIKLQMESYDRVIRENPGWEIAGIYADPGKTGTNMAGRPQFKKMIEDAKAGKIDMILVKSASRFARNTVDLLSTVRDLSSRGIGVFFEKEKINTLSLQSEMLLTVYAAFAQEESRSISENMKRGIRQRFEMGIPKWALTYGLQSDGNDHWTINEEEAAVVRKIYEMVLDGAGVDTIAAYLNEQGIKCPGYTNQTDTWWGTSIGEMVRNEKYCGDVRMQKFYTVDRTVNGEFRFHDSVRNKEIDQYYAKDHHPAIVPRDVYEDANMVLLMRNVHRGAVQYPYYGRLLCPHCGKPMVRVPVRAGKTSNAWICGGEGNGIYYSERTKCPIYCVREPYLTRAVRNVILNLDASLLQPEDAKKAEEVQEKLRGRETVEFLDLRKLVKSITFPDWDTVEITWVWGEKSSGQYKVDRPSDYPDPKVRVENGKSMIGPFELQSNAVKAVVIATESLPEKIDKVQIIESAVRNFPEPPFVATDAERRYEKAAEEAMSPKPKMKREPKNSVKEP